MQQEAWQSMPIGQESESNWTARAQSTALDKAWRVTGGSLTLLRA